MQSKLTLRLDDDLINKAKVYSARSGKSLSRMVADFFTAIGDEKETASPLTPAVKALLGALAGKGLTEEDYREHLEAKHK
jgi:hypothetical protein